MHEIFYFLRQCGPVSAMCLICGNIIQNLYLTVMMVHLVHQQHITLNPSQSGQMLVGSAQLVRTTLQCIPITNAMEGLKEWWHQAGFLVRSRGCNQWEGGWNRNLGRKQEPGSEAGIPANGRARRRYGGPGIPGRPCVRPGINRRHACHSSHRQHHPHHCTWHPMQIWFLQAF